MDKCMKHQWRDVVWHAFFARVPAAVTAREVAHRDRLQRTVNAKSLGSSQFCLPSVSVTRAHGDEVTAALDGDQNSVTVPSATQDSMA